MCKLNRFVHRQRYQMSMTRSSLDIIPVWLNSYTKWLCFLSIVISVIKSYKLLLRYSRHVISHQVPHCFLTVLANGLTPVMMITLNVFSARFCGFQWFSVTSVFQVTCKMAEKISCNITALWLLATLVCHDYEQFSSATAPIRTCKSRTMKMTIFELIGFPSAW